MADANFRELIAKTMVAIEIKSIMLERFPILTDVQLDKIDTDIKESTAALIAAIDKTLETAHRCM